MTGKFIVIEGLEGAGKSSVIDVVKRVVTDRGYTCINTREPGGTPMAEAIRECVKHEWQESVSEETELMLMYAARRQLLVNVIQPALAKGHWVIGDRHDLSSLAYQGGGRQIDADKLDALRQLCLQGFRPDLTLYLDVDPAEGLKRARGRGELDRIEKSGLGFFERTRERYLQLANSDDRVHTVDAMQPMNKVHETVRKTIEAYLS
ncbi:dTMP kinase [Aestuariibacter sp. A3R04]|uniref:dTMP kinase n=1 Tax=Aestuariibacter sp. A3R04 TaxID=2841571 RepID=UPI001C0960C7|nr:dTMP kinase [Aestuariibacter sp. A3R04]MBU3022725.1 dTMP kinase [Aestuariibacter sp. A3R04]